MRQDEDLTEQSSLPGDTIVALSTARGLGAVAVLRLSGRNAWSIAQSIVAERGKFKLLEERQMALFDLVDGDGNRLDRALAVKFAGGRSYTGEEMVELHCHGGLAVSSAVIDRARELGAIPARAGEFTRRAFLNGRLDLVQAEAVDSLIHARTEEGRQAAMAGMAGDLGKTVENMRGALLDIRSELEYRIDFPDEAGQSDSPESIASLIDNTINTLDKLLAGAERSLLASRGALAVIAGAPNVGKSSLFNRLLDEQRSIVTDTPGTTRDAVEREVVIDGHLVRLVDTAGLREGEQEAEQIGVEYSKKYIASSDLVVFVHEAGTDFGVAEKEFLASHGDRNLVRAVNKVDMLPGGQATAEGYIPVSAKTGEGIDRLRSMIAAAVSSGENAPGGNGAVVTSMRQKKLLEQARGLLGRIEPAAPADMLAEDIGEICDCLGEITGSIGGEDVLEAVFSRFCIGK